MGKVRIAVIIVILLVGVWVALSPGLVYAPTPRVVLYLLVALLPAILFGAEATSQFKLNLPGFIFSTTGAAAVCLGALMLLTYLSKPEAKIAVYQVYDTAGQPLPLQGSGLVEVPVTPDGFSVAHFVEGNTVVLIFPEQAAQAVLRVKKFSTGPWYSATVTYAGSRLTSLTLDKELKANTP
jgi:hypothetical protein